MRPERRSILAKAAELNGYPGPMHVLELADSLGLSDQQRAKVQELFAAMKAEAIPLGEKLIAQEADLDRQFANKNITPASLAASTDAIGTTDATLRRTPTEATYFAGLGFGLRALNRQSVPSGECHAFGCGTMRI